MYPGLIGWIVIGLMAGWLAGKITRGQGFGVIADVLLGLVGAVVGGWIFSRLGVTSYGYIGSLACATVGASLLIALARFLSGARG